MIIEINELNREEFKVGSIVVSKNDDVLLVLKNDEDGFKAFDLEQNLLRGYNSQEAFERYYTIGDVYQGDEIVLKLNKI